MHVILKYCYSSIFILLFISYKLITRAQNCELCIDSTASLDHGHRKGWVGMGRHVMHDKFNAEHSAYAG